MILLNLADFNMVEGKANCWSSLTIQQLTKHKTDSQCRHRFLVVTLDANWAGATITNLFLVRATRQRSLSHHRKSRHGLVHARMC